MIWGIQGGELKGRGRGADGEPWGLAKLVREEQEANSRPRGERPRKDKPKEWVCKHIFTPEDCPKYSGKENLPRPNRLELSFRTPPTEDNYLPPKLEMWCGFIS